MRILGPPQRLDLILDNLPPSGHARFARDMAPALWHAATHYGISPAGMVAQAWKETGGGNFTGQVRPEFCNTCGLKNIRPLYPGVDDGDRPLAHARFANWQVGAHAHAQHLLAYCGVKVAGLVVDPRFHVVRAPFVTDWEQLSGRWAPSPTYGQEIAALAAKLAA